jgi:hypothetical protein
MAGSGYGKKETKLVSGQTVERYREPTARKLVENVTQFIFDHKVNAKVVPNRIKGALIEASTMADNKSDHQSINGSGRSAVFGPLGRADLGGSPDEPGLAGRVWKGR